MDKKIIHRLKAYISRPDVYEPPTFKQLLAVIEELEADLKKMGRKSD